MNALIKGLFFIFFASHAFVKLSIQYIAKLWLYLSQPANFLLSKPVTKHTHKKAFSVWAPTENCRHTWTQKSVYTHTHTHTHNVQYIHHGTRRIQPEQPFTHRRHRSGIGNKERAAWGGVHYEEDNIILIKQWEIKVNEGRSCR